jgi:hypothetical protein
MSERKNEGAAPGRGKDATEKEMTLQRSQQGPKDARGDASNGSLPKFQSPAQLDSWFDAQLMQVYSEVVSEPLPKEFVDLLQKLKDKSPR